MLGNNAYPPENPLIEPLYTRSGKIAFGQCIEVLGMDERLAAGGKDSTRFPLCAACRQFGKARRRDPQEASSLLYFVVLGLVCFCNDL